MPITSIDPADLDPRHPPRIASVLASLTESMTEEGWSGRPLLVIDNGKALQALTGSHRIAAAIAAGLAEVPCYVLRVSRTRAPKWLQAVDDAVLDHELLQALRGCSDEDAISLMSWEIAGS